MQKGKENTNYIVNITTVFSTRYTGVNLTSRHTSDCCETDNLCDNVRYSED